MSESPKLLPCPLCGMQPHQCMTALDVVIAECRTEACPASYNPTCADRWNKRAPDHEREAMARVCEAAKEAADEEQAHRAVGWSARNDLRKALDDLERARKGEG